MRLSTEELVEKTKAGDQHAFRELVSVIRGRAFGLCYNIVGNPEDAKDILQEALVKAYRNIGRFRRDSSFETWFYSILVNSARDFLRQKVRRAKVILRPGRAADERLLLARADLRKGPEKALLSRELSQMLDRAIQALPEKQRLCFVMKHVQGMKIDEISRILGCRSQTVKAHLFKAARNLRKKLAPYLSATL